MAFGIFKSVSDVAQTYQVSYAETEFVLPLLTPLNDHFRSELAFVLREVDFSNSEFSVCENLIYPVLKEVWKGYTASLMLWGHQPLFCDEMLSGVPDYLLARRSPLGKVVRGTPYVCLVVEAKKDNFEEGWGQCLAAMIAAQRLNHDAEQTIYGIVSNGRVWEFGNLHLSSFTHEPRLFTIQDLDELHGAVNFVFAQCQHQLAEQALTA